MKAISLIQPWGTLIYDEIKTIETRTWGTEHRGDLLICAGKKFQHDYSDIEADLLKKVFRAHGYKPKLEHKQGVALCVVKLIHVRDMTEDDVLMACYPCTPGRKAWLITEVRPVKPVPIKGKLSLFDVDDSLIKIDYEEGQRRHEEKLRIAEFVDRFNSEG